MAPRQFPYDQAEGAGAPVRRDAGQLMHLSSSSASALIFSRRAAREARAVRRRKGLLQDGEAAYREVHARGYDGDRIVLMGASLGTGVAIALGRGTPSGR